MRRGGIKMRASQQEQTGGAGAHEVSSNFERIGWGPIPNEAHDLGTDLLVQARDLRRFDRGLIIGVQVKAGESWFSDPVQDEDGNLVGWSYYESGTAHFDDWVKHCLPHVLVLHDLAARVSYWVHVTADQVIGTGKGCRIVVPVAQTVDEAHREGLLAVAALQRAASPLEGTSFGASAGAVPPGRRLRYAVLAPRLVAPHRNVGYANPIGPEEALALCAQGRFRDLIQFATDHAAVPDPQQEYTGSQWRWKFVAAAWAWMISDDLDQLMPIVGAAPDPECRAAGGVLLACALNGNERLDEALAHLTALIDADDLSPVDHGWALIQRARFHAEIGAIDAATADAIEAQRHLVGDADDVTASALAAAVAWTLYTTATGRSGDLGATLTASDTAISWWRSQTRSWALSEAATRSFRAWAHDKTSRWSAEDSEAINLFAAELNADLTGEHGTWRAERSLRARQQIMKTHREGDIGGLTAGLIALRRSGDKESLKLAYQHLRQSGPLVGLAHAVESIGIDNWTSTTVLANLEALSIAGDLAESTMAEGWINYLVGVLEDPSNFEARFRPTFVTALPIVEAIAGLLPASGAAGRRRAYEFIAAFEEEVDDILVRPIARWFKEARSDDLTDDLRDQFRELGTTDHRALGSSVLGYLAAQGDEQAKQEVHDRAVASDLDALSAMGDITAFDSPVAESLLASFVDRVIKKVDNADGNHWGLGGVDAGRAVAMFNLWFPDISQWDPLLRLLEHPHVTTEDKRGALELVITLQARLPSEVRERLAASIEAIGAAEAVADVGGRPISGLVACLGIVTGAIAEEDVQATVAKLAMGSEQDRIDAAGLLGDGWCPSGRALLASFAADPRPTVRRAAAYAVGRLVSEDPDPLTVELVRVLAADTGAVIPPALLVGCSRSDKKSERGSEVATGLRTHPSARVRRLALEYLTTFPTDDHDRAGQNGAS